MLSVASGAWVGWAVHAKEVWIYGEGYGGKIQKGENYLGDRTDFILFDVNVDGWWLTCENLDDVATKLGIDIVPIVGRVSLMEGIEMVKTGFKSTIAHNKDNEDEGLILKPEIELFNRRGNRIVTKIKHPDFSS